MLSHYWCSRPALFLCFYTGETSRLWWASVLLLSEPRQSVRTVRVPYRPSVFAPFCLKSAGLALIWASAVLLWFLALLYTRGRGLSIRRMHNELVIFFSRNNKKIVLFAQTEDRNSLPAQSERPAGPFVGNLCARTAKLLPRYLPPRWTERPVSLYYKQVILLNKDKLLMIAVCVFIASQEISATSKQHIAKMPFWPALFLKIAIRKFYPSNTWQLYEFYIPHIHGAYNSAGRVSLYLKNETNH